MSSVEKKRVEKPQRNRERLHGSIARRLGIAIVSGEIRPGDILDNEIASSEQLSVSRTAYREAVRILAAKGLVTSRPKLGTKVCERSEWHLLDPQVLAWLFESKPGADVVAGLFELRMMIEPEAAALAASRRSDQHIADMRGALQSMQTLGLANEGGQTADREFHDLILAATGNPALIALSSTIGATVRWTTIYKQRERKLPRDPVPDHWRVFEAIEAGKPAGARRAMAELVRLALDDTHQSMTK